MDLSVKAYIRNPATAGANYFASCSATITESFDVSTMTTSISVSWSATIGADGYTSSYPIKYNGTSRPDAGVLWFHDGVGWKELGTVPLTNGKKTGDTLASGQISYERNRASTTGLGNKCYLNMTTGTTADPNNANPPLYWADTDGGVGDYIARVHRVHFCESNSDTDLVQAQWKVYGYHFYVPSYETDLNYFNGWKTNSALGENFSAGTIFNRVNSSQSDKLEYTWDQNGGDIYLHWVPGASKGAAVVLDANIYYNQDYLNNDSYEVNNYKFPGTGLNASWTKFTSSAKYNSKPYEYRTNGKIYPPNDNTVASTIRGTPYVLDEFNVEFCGYYTGKTWSSPGIKTYELKKEWIHEVNRNYAVIAVPDNEYFGTATTVSQDDWDLINLYPAGGSGENDELEQPTSDSLWVPKIAGAKITTPINLPPWLKTARTEPYVFYALWSKPNLTFTYNPGSGTAPANNENIQLIGTPGPASEEGKVQSFTIKTFQQTRITPPIGYKFKEWNTASDGTGQTIAVQTIQLGGYLNDVTLYAQYEPYQHTIQFYRQDEDQPLSSATITGGTSWHIANIPTENPNDPHLKFSGIYDANGNIAFDKQGDPVNGIYFTNGLWDYKSDDTNLNLYLRWGLPSNAFIYENNEWKQGVILVNIAESGQEPIWEQIDLADFL